jgi:hypothetical protein
MNNDKKIYLYSGLSIVGAIIAYVIITRKKPLLNDASEGSGEKDPETNISVSTTGEVVEQAQVVIPKSLSDILNKTTAQSTALLINKPIYTKLDNVKVRNSNYVNNGIIDNIMSTISSSGFLLGNVIQVVEDKGKLKNNEGRVYRWFKIKPAQITLDEMNKNKSFLTHVFLPNSTGREIYVREDTVKLEKK